MERKVKPTPSTKPNGISYGRESSEQAISGNVETMSTVEELFHELAALRIRVERLEALYAKAGEALTHSESKYRHFYENALEGIFQTTPGGRLISANPTIARMYGYTSPREMIEALTDIENQTYVDPEDRARFKRILEKDGMVSDFEARYYRKDGEIRWQSINARAVKDAKGNTLCYEGFVEDITGRKETEEALRDSAVKYRTVVEDSLVGFYIIQDGYFRFVNKRFCDMFGYTYEEIVDILGPNDLTHSDDRDKIDEIVQKRIDGEIEHIEYDFRSTRKDGKVINVKVLGSAIHYQGKPAAVGSIIDITRERDLESKLRQAQKMGAIGTLAGGIAHDFNNILTILIGYGELLAMGTNEGDQLREYVDQILSTSMKAAQLTGSLLTFSRQQPTVLDPLDINCVIRETERLLRRLITEDIALHTVFAAEELIVMADASQIDQILFNLATNARDAMPDGGTLTIETRSVSVDPAFVEIHGFGEPGEYVLISLSDTGIGMDATTREQIFDPFFTTKEVGKGTGLGLSTVYGIVTQHKGFIAVYSEPQIGTSFHIYLPTVRGPSDKKSHTSRVVGGTEKLLIAEDNDAVRRAISDILRKYGYTVLEAVDGQHAVEVFFRQPDIDLIILDSIMPKKNGREAYEDMKEMNPTLKALFISGYTRDIVLDKGIRDREFPFIAKPVLPAALLQTIRRILDK